MIESALKKATNLGKNLLGNVVNQVENAAAKVA